MKIILNIKLDNKDATPFVRELEVTPEEADKLANIGRKIYGENACTCEHLSVYVKEF